MDFDGIVIHMKGLTSFQSLRRDQPTIKGHYLEYDRHGSRFMSNTNISI